MGAPTEAAIRHRNLQRALSLTLGEVKQMISDGNDRVLKLEYQRTFREETLDRLTAVSLKLDELSRTASGPDGEEVFHLRVEEICDCPIHVGRIKAIGIVTLADFLFPQDPMALLKEVFLADQESSVSHPQLLTRMMAKITVSVRKILERKERAAISSLPAKGRRSEPI